MCVLRGAEQNCYLKPGTPVRLAVLTSEDALLEPEVGVVVHCWHQADLERYFCIVAFFGRDFPEGAPIKEPHLVTHSSTSLAVLSMSKVQGQRIATLREAITRHLLKAETIMTLEPDLLGEASEPRDFIEAVLELERSGYLDYEAMLIGASPTPQIIGARLTDKGRSALA
jgi:uncharacterized small protein (DUF1192 family)